MPGTHLLANNVLQPRLHPVHLSVCPSVTRVYELKNGISYRVDITSTACVPMPKKTFLIFYLCRYCYARNKTRGVRRIKRTLSVIYST